MKAAPLVVAAPVSRGPLLISLAVGYVVALALIPVEIDRAFGLPAHPLLLHVPVVLIPLLVLATVAVVARPDWRERFGLAWGALAVVALAATVLAVGAGQKFLDQQPFASAVLHDHKEAADTLRILMFAFVAVVLLVLLQDLIGFGGRGAGVALSVVVVLLAAASGFFVVRTGHLGAKATWEKERRGPRPGGFPGAGAGGRSAPTR